jgi:RNA 2',3'-cyclic 3'-phosphodiesterase
MSDSIRSFIAIKIPGLDPLRRVLKDLSAMGRALKTVDADNLHVTLKFLGETEVNLVPDILELVKEEAAALEPCQLTIAGLGVFPHAQRPSVVWAGLEGAQTLTALAVDLGAGLELMGFPRESRPFVPHLTLARIKAKPPESLGALLSRHAKTKFGAATIEQVELIRSELGPEGSRYTVLGTARLGAATDRP